jgi:NAD-specific glutamate dehydrogenase
MSLRSPIPFVWHYNVDITTWKLHVITPFLVAFRRFSDMSATGSRSLRSANYVRTQHFIRRSTYVPFRRYSGDVRREFMQRLYVALHGTMGSYLRDALHEGSADAVACLPVPRA